MKLSKIFCGLVFCFIANVCVARTSQLISFKNTTDSDVSVQSVSRYESHINKIDEGVYTIKPSDTKVYNITVDSVSKTDQPAVMFLINNLEYLYWWQWTDNWNWVTQLFSYYDLSDPNFLKGVVRRDWSQYYSAVCGTGQVSGCFESAVSDYNADVNIDIKPVYYNITFQNNTDSSVTITPNRIFHLRASNNTESKKTIPAGEKCTFTYADTVLKYAELINPTVSFDLDKDGARVDWSASGHFGVKNVALSLIGPSHFSAEIGVKHEPWKMDGTWYYNYDYKNILITINSRESKGMITVNNNKQVPINFGISGEDEFKPQCVILPKFPDAIYGKGTLKLAIKEDLSENCAMKDKEVTFEFSSDRITWVKHYNADTHSWEVKVKENQKYALVNKYSAKCGDLDCYNTPRGDSSNSTVIDINDL
jgi:hypothetical protein